VQVERRPLLQRLFVRRPMRRRDRRVPARRHRSSGNLRFVRYDHTLLLSRL